MTLSPAMDDFVMKIQEVLEGFRGVIGKGFPKMGALSLTRITLEWAKTQPRSATPSAPIRVVTVVFCS